jgi:hypothetical protein
MQVLDLDACVSSYLNSSQRVIGRVVCFLVSHVIGHIICSCRSPGAFVMSFVVVVNWTLLQVSVAVLLDNFVAETAREKDESHDQGLSLAPFSSPSPIHRLPPSPPPHTHTDLEQKRSKDTMGNPLDALLSILAHEYIDDDDLDSFLSRLWTAVFPLLSFSLSLSHSFCNPPSPSLSLLFG